MPEVPDTVDDAIEPLVSPSTNDVFEATLPFSAREIGSAAVSEALSGAGSQPVSCFLSAPDGIDVHDIGTHPVLWTAMSNGPRGSSDFPPVVLTEIPEGLGLTFDFDGTGDGSIEPTEPGFWAFTFAVDLAGPDATFDGFVSDRIMGESGFGQGGGGPTNAQFASIFYLPFFGGGAGPIFAIFTVTEATADPFPAQPLLSIVRLG